jgi:hypothetical protein
MEAVIILFGNCEYDLQSIDSYNVSVNFTPIMIESYDWLGFHYTAVQICV